MSLRNIFTLSMLAGSVALAGCSSIPSIGEHEQVTKNQAVEQAKETADWLQDPAVTRLSSSVGQIVQRPNAVPARLRAMPVDIKFPSGATIRDLMHGLTIAEGLPTIAEDESLLDNPVRMTQYKGTLGELLDILAYTQNIDFSWRNNTLNLAQSSIYVITLPQDKELLDNIKTDITAYGASDVHTSLSSGTIFYRATPRNQENIGDYISRTVNNSSLITLQIMVLNVILEQDRRQGFDWGNLQAQLGNVGAATASASSEASVIEGLARNTGMISGQGAVFNVAKNSFNLSGVFNLLSNYGNVKTTQDVSLKTLGGKKVSLESVQKIPYVSDINLSTLESGTSSSGLETDTVNNGLTINFTPQYEADSELVSVEIDISLDTLLGFVNLSAGNQIGEITQPRTQVQKFNNTVRIPAGETVILGGVTYESLSDNRSSISVLDNADVADLKENLTSNSLFVVIRPTVTVYERQEGR